jgi:hypothetical protein
MICKKKKEVKDSSFPKVKTTAEPPQHQAESAPSLIVNCGRLSLIKYVHRSSPLSTTLFSPSSHADKSEAHLRPTPYLGSSLPHPSPPRPLSKRIPRHPRNQRLQHPIHPFPNSQTSRHDFLLSTHSHPLLIHPSPRKINRLSSLYRYVPPQFVTSGLNINIPT